MKNIIIGVGIFIIIITLSCTSSLPLVLDENIGRPLTLSVISSPDSIGSKSVEVLIKYAWNGNKSKFEQKQGAVGRIEYSFIPGKFDEKKHCTDGEYRYDDLSETGVIKYNATNSLSSSYDRGCAIGQGGLIFTITCSYKDEDSNKHKGTVSNILEIPVIFTK